MFPWDLSLLSVTIARFNFKICEGQVKCSSKITPGYFTEFAGNSLFSTNSILKELFNFVSCLWNTTSSVLSTFRKSLFAFSHIESTFSHFFSDHDWFSFLMFSVNCLRELYWDYLKIDMSWSILDKSGGYWRRWVVTMDLAKILEALQILFLWLLRLASHEYIVIPLGIRYEQNQSLVNKI